MKNRKHSVEFKTKVVRYCIDKKASTRQASRKFKVTGSLIKMWREIYKYHGAEGFVRVRNHFTVDEKVHILQEMDQQGWSLRTTLAFYKIGSDHTLKKWIKDYTEEGREGLMKTSVKRRLPMRIKTVAETMRATSKLTRGEMREELEFLRAENAYLKKLEALVQKKLA